MISTEIKTEFVRQVLDKYGKKLMDAFEKSIRERDLIKDEILLSSLGYNVVTGDKFMDGMLQIVFVMHRRYQDMNAYRKPVKLKTENPEKNSRHYNKPKQKKTPGWYTHNVYGHLNSMIYSLLYYLDDEMVKYIKEKLGSNS